MPCVIATAKCSWVLRQDFQKQNAQYSGDVSNSSKILDSEF